MGMKEFRPARKEVDYAGEQPPLLTIIRKRIGRITVDVPVVKRNKNTVTICPERSVDRCPNCHHYLSTPTDCEAPAVTQV